MAADDSVANLLLRVTSDSDDAQQDLGTLAAGLMALDKLDADPEINLDATGAQAELAGFAAACKALDESDVEVNVQMDLDDGIRQLELFTKKMEGAASRDFNSKFFKADAGSQTNLLAGVPEQLSLLHDRLASWSAQVSAADNQSIDVDVDVDMAAAQAQLSLFAAELSALDGREIDVSVDADTGGAMGQLALFSAISETFGGDTSAKASGFFSVLQNGLTSVMSMGGALKDLGEAGGGAGRGLSGVTANLGPFGARLGPIVGIILAVAAAIMTALVASLAALAASAALAAGAVIALGTALLVALGPIVAAMLPVLMSLGKVLKVLQAEQQEAATAAQRKAQADLEARQYAQQHADAVRNLQRAIESQTDSEKQSRQQIADARLNERRSVQDLRDATVQAYREMADAIEGVKDAELSLERSRLSKDQATLGIKQAEKDLDDFRKKSKTAGKDLDSVFKKFTDVDFKGNLGDLNTMLASKGAAVNQDKELELERLVLAVRDARLRQKEATNAVGDAERGLTEAQQRNADFQQRGIRASEQYRAALQGVQDARRGVARAEEQAAAQEKAAAQQVADARRNLRQLESNRAYQLQHGNILKSASLTQELTGQEKQLLAVVKDLWAAIQTTFGPSSQAIIAGMIEGLKKVGPALRKLQGPFTRLGKVIGSSIERFFTMLASDEMVGQFQRLVTAAGQVAGPIALIFGSMLQLILQIAEAAMPFLIMMLNEFASIMAGLVAGPGVSGFRAFIAQLIPHLYTWLNLAFQIAKVLMAFFLAAAPAGQQLADAIAQIAEKFAAWLNSEDGRRQIQNFFDAVIPMALSFARWVGKIVVFFIRLTEAAAPLMDVLFDLFTIATDLANTFLHAVGAITRVLGKVLDAITETMVVAVDKLTGFVDKFIAIGISWIQGLINGIKDKAGDLINAAGDVAKGAAKAVGKVFKIGSPSKLMMEMGKDVMLGFQVGLQGQSGAIAAQANRSIAQPVLRQGARAGDGASGGRARTVIEHQEVILPSAPGYEGMGDPTDAAVKFAREMARRGSAPVGP